MTECNATSANGFPLPEPKRVTSWENQELDGKVLCGQSVLDSHNAKVRDARDRQATYIKSLPNDPIEACKAIRGRLNEVEEPRSDLTIAKEALIIIAELLRFGDVGNYPDLQAAIANLSERGENALKRHEEAVRWSVDATHRISDAASEDGFKRFD